MQKHIVLLNDKRIIELDFAKHRDLSVSRRSIICLCLRHWQIIDLLATDKSRYFAQPRPIIVYYHSRYFFRRFNWLRDHYVTANNRPPPTNNCLLMRITVRSCFAGFAANNFARAQLSHLFRAQTQTRARKPFKCRTSAIFHT